MDILDSIKASVQERANELSNELIDKVVSRLIFLDGIPTYTSSLILNYIAYLREYACAKIRLTRLQRESSPWCGYSGMKHSNVYNHAEYVWNLKQRKDVLRHNLREHDINTDLIDLIVGREPRDTTPWPTSLYLNL